MTLERVSNPSREVLESFILKSQPFIITDVADKWPCYSNWRSNYDYLPSKLGEREIPMRELGYNVGEWLGKTSNVKFSEFYKLWKDNQNNQSTPTTTTTADTTKNPLYYLASLPVRTYFPELESEYTVPDFAKEQNKSANLWIGSAGQVTPLHHDWSTGDPGMDGLHAIIIGKNYLNFMIQQLIEWGLFHHALVDCESPNLEKYPEFANAQVIDVILEAGEILFIPKLWWHHVRTLEHAISLNFWFQHIGSEKLKCTRFWPHMEEYLNAIYNMDMKEERMTTLLMYFADGYSQKNKPTEADVRYYIDNPIKFMQLPKFIHAFGNAANNPLVKSPEADLLATELRTMVKEWIDNKALSLNDNSSQPKYSNNSYSNPMIDEFFGDLIKTTDNIVKQTQSLKNNIQLYPLANCDDSNNNNNSNVVAHTTIIKKIHKRLEDVDHQLKHLLDDCNSTLGITPHACSNTSNTAELLEAFKLMYQQNEQWKSNIQLPLSTTTSTISTTNRNLSSMSSSSTSSPVNNNNNLLNPHPMVAPSKNAIPAIVNTKPPMAAPTTTTTTTLQPLPMAPKSILYNNNQNNSVNSQSSNTNTTNNNNNNNNGNKSLPKIEVSSEYSLNLLKSKLPSPSSSSSSSSQSTTTPTVQHVATPVAPTITLPISNPPAPPLVIPKPPLEMVNKPVPTISPNINPTAPTRPTTSTPLHSAIKAPVLISTTTPLLAPTTPVKISVPVANHPPPPPTPTHSNTQPPIIMPTTPILIQPKINTTTTTTTTNTIVTTKIIKHVTKEEIQVLENNYLTKIVHLDILNQTIHCINEFLKKNHHHHGGEQQHFNESNLINDMSIPTPAKSKPILLLLLQLGRIESKKTIEGDTIFCSVGVI
ncbi:transcription factor jumonji [Cavenderia fasciculata]|uniref:Transcription factor jumonji n=1 Tax=Cavenderia fasciculata TaxID=261658 RepID=F4QDU1_CACFS|nr:transcription factor jumonji [Cavenderia fasciculata]EGG13888.1 transcription factor jumonji [Cavenderia fasciculata]|eukprot:XP_004350596.1 transcription factor jumonji [Cavenderia fasciculata]